MPRLSASTSRKAPYSRREGPRVQACNACKLNRQRCVVSKEGGSCERCVKRREECTSRKVDGDEGISARNAYSRLLSMTSRLAALEGAFEARVRQRAAVSEVQDTKLVAFHKSQEDAWLDAPLEEGYWSLASRDSVLAELGHVHIPSYAYSSTSESSRATVSTAPTSPRWSVCDTLPSSPIGSPRTTPRSTFDSDLLASFTHSCHPLSLYKSDLPLSPPRATLVFPVSPLLVPIPLPNRLPVPEEEHMPRGAMNSYDVPPTLENSRGGVPMSFERVACGA